MRSTAVVYLAFDDLMMLANTVIGEVEVRDYGLLEAALARPQATVYGTEAYPTVSFKAAALTHSLARNHALIDGNKRLALVGLIAFLGLNGYRLSLTNNEAYDLIMDIAQGHFEDIDLLAKRIE